MKILLIFTGGTIGSIAKSDYISPDSKTKYILTDNFFKKHHNNNEILFDTISPYTILSENITAKHFNMLISAVRSNLNKGYDGIIITHGTDTLQYTAKALSLAFEASETPIILVSSNYPLNDNRANGNENFRCAVDYIASKEAGGVFVSYKNNADKTARILPANNLYSHAEMDDKVYSKNCNKSTPISNLHFCDNPKILVINSFVGDDYSYDIKDKNAVIIRPFHSGTINTASENLHRFCKTAQHLKIPIYLVNLPDEINYESTSIYNQLGIIAIKDSLFIPTYVELWAKISMAIALDNTLFN